MHPDVFPFYVPPAYSQPGASMHPDVLPVPIPSGHMWSSTAGQMGQTTTGQTGTYS